MYKLTMMALAFLGMFATGSQALADDSGTLTGTVQAMPARFLPETVVYLKNVPGNYEPKTVTMDQVRMEFVPHMLAITVRDTVTFLNHDGMPHDVFTTDNEKYSLGSLKTGETRSYTYTKENVGYAQLCHFHPEMLAYVFVGQNPYLAIPDKTGRFTINNIPPGTWQLAVWNPRLKGAEQNVTISRNATATATVSIHR